MFMPDWISSGRIRIIGPTRGKHLYYDRGDLDGCASTTEPSPTRMWHARKGETRRISPVTVACKCRHTEGVCSITAEPTRRYSRTTARSNTTSQSADQRRFDMSLVVEATTASAKQLAGRLHRSRLLAARLLPTADWIATRSPEDRHIHHAAGAVNTSSSTARVRNMTLLTPDVSEMRFAAAA